MKMFRIKNKMFKQDFLFHIKKKIVLCSIFLDKYWCLMYQFDVYVCIYMCVYI